MNNRPIDPKTGEIDWAEVRSRVAKAFDPLHGETASAQTRAVLAERAIKLALANDRNDIIVDMLTVLPFRLGREQYALETRFAREVVRLTDFTTLPGAPDFLIGVVNLRGQIVPVFDLMRFFGFASKGLMDRSRVIVVGTADVEFGIIADKVLPVTRLRATEIVADAVFEGERGGECVRGVTADAVIVLDGAALMQDRRLFVGAPAEATP